MGNQLGSWAFLLGVIIAVIFGIVDWASGTSPEWVGWILVILGLVVGLMNITDKEANPFMISGVILVLVSWLGADVMSTIGIVQSVLNAILMLFVPATIIVALKSVWGIAKK